MARVAILFALVLASAHAWTTQELELYDLVEEVGVNFYDFLGISQVALLDIPSLMVQTASDADIRRAFRTRSLELHPDKNDAPTAETDFRHLVREQRAMTLRARAGKRSIINSRAGRHLRGP